MRLRRDEPDLDPAIERELVALEAALAGRPVGPEHADLAELANDLERARPEPSQQFAADLDAAVASGFGGGRRAGRFGGLGNRLGGVPPRRILLGGAAGAFAAVVIATAVVSIGGSRTDEAPESVPHAALPVSPVQSPSRPAQTAGAASTGDSAGPEFQDRAGIEAAPARPAPAAASPSGPFASQQSRRAVERSAQLVLGTDPDAVRPAADRVFATVGRYDGIVLRSSIRDGDSGEAGADFSLLIPSERLSAALTDLSAIAEVRSREESARDITAPTVTVSDHLREARAEVKGLLGQLAEADSDSERAAIKEQLRFQQRRVATLRASLNDLRRRANFSRVSVQLLTGDAAVFPASGSDRWTVGDAAADAVRILAVAAGVTLVGLAALGPIALLAALAWLGRRAWVRAGRERALEG
jgi:Domain of unknown function (DUF4349)